jgi:hypothetical protein
LGDLLGVGSAKGKLPRTSVLPHVFGVPKWFTALVPARAGSAPRINEVILKFAYEIYKQIPHFGHALALAEVLEDNPDERLIVYEELFKSSSRFSKFLEEPGIIIPDRILNGCHHPKKQEAAILASFVIEIYCRM